MGAVLDKAIMIRIFVLSHSTKKSLRQFKRLCTQPGFSQQSSNIVIPVRQPSESASGIDSGQAGITNMGAVI